MDVELGSHVFTRVGKDLGAVDKLVVDPRTGTVKAVAVRRGFILHHDVEVNVEDLAVGPGGRLAVACDADEADHLPPFEEANYTTAPVEYERPAGWPFAAIAWPVGYGGTVGPMADPVVGGDAADPRVREEVASALLAADLENAVVGEGSDVKDRDGEKVGDVARLGFDPASGRLEKLVVRRGFLGTEEVEVPANLVDSVGDGVVYLRVTADQVSPS